MRTKDSIIEEIIQFFKDNKSVFTTAIEELDDCNENGYLGDTRCRSMVELNDLFAGKEPVDILRCGFDGYDADTWSWTAVETRNMEPSIHIATISISTAAMAAW